MIGERNNACISAILVKVIRHHMHERKRDLADRLSERLIHRIRNRRRSLVRDLRCDHVLLLVGIVGDARLLSPVAIEGEHVFAER